MLKEVDQYVGDMCSASNPSIDDDTRSHLAIHQTNLFQPHKFTVTSIAASPHRVYLAARRGYLNPLDINHPFSQLDFYEMNTKTHPKHVQTIIEYEDITAISWLDHKRLITVSKQATINVYSIHSGTRICTYTSDYGPIMCMSYSVADGLLVTGTEYGYAACYRMSPSIECVGKMIKLNESINAIDFFTQPREAPAKKIAVAKIQPAAKSKVKPGKRKRTESSDESEDEDDKVDSETNDEAFLAKTDVTIYGACDFRVVAWDYHRATIVDTVKTDQKLCSLRALSNGDFAVGDIAGYLSIFDKNTFTCRQCDMVLENSVLCVARDDSSTTLLAAGKDSTITILKRDTSIESSDEYRLFEKIKDHQAQVNSALCLSAKEYYTCSDDNLIMKFRTSKSKGHAVLKRFQIRQNYRDKIHWNTNELMLTFGKTLLIYKMDSDPQFRSEIVSYPIQQALADPYRTCSIKPSLYIHAAALDDKWICYSTSKGITTIDRPALSHIGEPSKNLPCCHIMRLCKSGKYLVAGQYKTLTVVELKNEPREQQVPQLNGGVTQTTHDDKKSEETDTQKPQSDAPNKHVHKTAMLTKLKGFIRNILYHESSDRLIVTCGTTGHLVYVYELQASITGANGNGDHGNEIKLVSRASLQGCSPSSHLTLNYHDKSDTNLYMCTTRNQFIKHDIASKRELSKIDLTDQNVGKISGLHKETNIKGLIILSQRYALLYDAEYIYKLDMDLNRVINTTAKYDNINVVCDTIFGRQDEILIV